MKSARYMIWVLYFFKSRGDPADPTFNSSTSKSSHPRRNDWQCRKTIRCAPSLPTNPEWGLLHPDMKGSGNVLLEANYITTLLSLNCLSLRAQPFSTLVQSCHFTACVWGAEKNDANARARTHAHTHAHTHTWLQARIPWNAYCPLL